ncbi:hypothetical protein ON010_g2749 [Phytophthora cinnamomi]|nr:hypothetical protein ON010_g2749 [Phytophthora cinnamomi]
MRGASMAVLLAVAVLLACIDTGTALAVTSAAFTTADIPFGHESSTRSSRLLRRYEDIGEERAGVLDKVTELVKAGASKVKQGVAKAHEVGLFQAYLYSADDGLEVMNKLKLGDNIADVLANPKLGTLSEYVGMFNYKYPKNKISVSGILSAKYGDDVVAMALVAAPRSGSTSQFRQEMKILRKEQRKEWFKEGKSADDVFNLLKLDDGVTSAKLDVLENYIRFANKNKVQQTDLLETLTKGYHGESNLVSALKRAKNDGHTGELALQMENLLLMKWLEKDELPEKVFKMLKLNDDFAYAFRSDNIKSIVAYTVEFNKKNPAKHISPINMFTASYKEDEVAQALAAAITTNRDDFAEKLLGGQLVDWFRRRKSVDDAFALLKTEQDATAAISSGKVDVLAEYIILLKRKGQRENLIKTLVKHFGGDGNLAVSVERAIANPRVANKAKALQEKQFSMWLKADVEPKTLLLSVFKVERATDEQKTIAAKYKTYYEKSPLTLKEFLIPRRA